MRVIPIPANAGITGFESPAVAILECAESSIEGVIARSIGFHSQSPLLSAN
jgi:hypothetical protein